MDNSREAQMTSVKTLSLSMRDDAEKKEEKETLDFSLSM